MGASYPEAEHCLLILPPSLKVVTMRGVGIDHLGVKVTHMPGAVSCAIAVIAMGLLLAPGEGRTENCYTTLASTQGLGTLFSMKVKQYKL